MKQYGKYSSPNRPRYLNAGDFTVVLTPHFQDQWAERKHLAGGEIGNGLIRDIWSAALVDRVCGTTVSEAFVYFRKTYNGVRERWELEFITVSPAEVFHTRRLKHATYVTL